MNRIPWDLREKHVYNYLPSYPIGGQPMRFFPKQEEVLRTVSDEVQFLTIVGGIGAAKSYTQALYVLPEIVLANSLRHRNNWRPVGDDSRITEANRINVWIVGPDHSMPRKEFQYLIDMLNGSPELLAMAGGWAQPVSIPREGECLAITGLGVTIKTKTWARVSGSDPLHTEPIHIMLVSEAGLLDDWTYENRLVPRIGRTNGIMVLGGTFEQSEQFLKRQYARGIKGSGHTKHKSFSIASWENPFSYPGGRQDPAILMMESEMSPDTFQERCAAVPKKAARLVHGIFDYDRHVKAVELDLKLPVKVWVDPGPSGYGVLVGQVRGEGKERTAYVKEEYFESNNGTSEKAIEWLIGRPYFARISSGAIDARSMEARDIWAMGTIWRTKGRHGLQLSARSVGVEAGIERVNSLLHSVVTGADVDKLKDKLVDFEGAKGIARIIIDPACKRLIWEVEEGYKYDKTRDGFNKPKPRDENNHLSKALAYGLVDEFGFVEPVRARPIPGRVPLQHLRRNYAR